MYDSKYTGAQIEEMLERAGSDLIEAGEDESYVVKVVDAEGALLAGFKESGEIAVPIGLTDDAYTLIKALYDKLAEAIPTLENYTDVARDNVIAYCDETFENAEERKTLIDSGTDDTYVLKMQDAEGTLLQGVKESGEVETPIGISDDAYTLFTSIYNKLNEIAQYLQDIK